MNIFFTEAGKGTPVIFIHGFCENHELWSNFQKKLSSIARVITIDLPGYGKSELEQEKVSIKEIAFQIKSLLDSQNINECIMIGHSLGGYVTLAFAEYFPQHLKGFGLFHSSAFADTPEKQQNRTKAIEFVEQNGVSPFVQTLIPSLFYEGRKQELKTLIDQQKVIANQTSAQTVIAYLAAMRDRKERLHVLKEFNKPILMIIGKEDQAVPYEKSLEQVKLIQKPHVLELEETGHMGMLEREEATLDFVKQFTLACQ